MLQVLGKSRLFGDGNDDYDSGTKTLSVDVSAEVGKAIIVLGGGNAEVNSEWRIFSNISFK